MSVLLAESDRQAVKQVQQFRTSIRISKGIDSFYDSVTLTPAELEHLNSVTIHEAWTDAEGRKHVRRF